VRGGGDEVWAPGGVWRRRRVVGAAGRRVGWAAPGPGRCVAVPARGAREFRVSPTFVAERLAEW